MVAGCYIFDTTNQRNRSAKNQKMDLVLFLFLGNVENGEGFDIHALV